MTRTRPAPIDDRPARLLRKQARKFAAALRLVLTEDSPEVVHDARVSSRRLRQNLDALFPKPRPEKARRLRRTLKRVRRALGGWRDCDVLIDLAEGERRKSPDDAERIGWDLVLEFLRRRRERRIVTARKKLAAHDPREFSKRLRKLLDRSRAGHGDKNLRRILPLGINHEWRRWNTTLKLAQARRDAASLHAFRIATKQTRYRIELMRDLKDGRDQPPLKWLKELQDALGAWHDRLSLHWTIADALAQPEVLRRKTGAARTLLAKMEDASAEQEKRLEEIFRLACDESRQVELAAWIGAGL